MDSAERQSGTVRIYNGTTQLNQHESDEEAACRINQNLVRENLVTESTAKEIKRSLEYRPESDRKLTVARELQCNGKSSASQAVSRRSHLLRSSGSDGYAAAGTL